MAAVTKLIRQNLSRRPWRTWSMIWFVFVLSFALFAMGVLLDSFSGSLTQTINRLGADLIVVPKEFDKNLADTLFLGKLNTFQFDRRWVDRIAQLEGIEALSCQTYFHTLSADCCSAPIQLIIYEPETDFVVQPWLERRDSPLPGHDEIYIGSKIIPPNPHELVLFGLSYRVLGQLETSNTAFDTCVFMTEEGAQRMLDSEKYQENFGEPAYRAEDFVSSVLIKVAAGTDAKSLARTINFRLDGAPVAAYTTFDIFSDFGAAAESLQQYVTLLFVVILILVIFALFIIFTITVNERTGEFGLLTSLGVSNGIMTRVILGEAALIGSTGGLLGAGLAYFLLVVFRIPLKQVLNLPRLDPTPGFALGLLGKCFVLALGVALLSASYAAWRIARSSPDQLMKGQEL